MAYGTAGRLFNLLFHVLWALAAAVWLSLAAARADQAPLVVMLGDSLTAGYGLAAKDALPRRLEAALLGRGVAVRIRNAGVSGDTTAGGRARLDWVLADRPGYVIVALGANDALRGIDPATTRANLDWILAELKRRGIAVLLAGMLAPPNLGREYRRRFDRLYPGLAARHGVLLYPFLLDGVAAEPTLNQADGIHPNPAGVAVISERLAPYVIRLLEDD